MGRTGVYIHKDCLVDMIIVQNSTLEFSIERAPGLCSKCRLHFNEAMSTGTKLIEGAEQDADDRIVAWITEGEDAGKAPVAS